MTAQAQTTARPKAARGRRSPRTILRNAFITTFMIFLAMYPVFDSFFGWGKMGAMPAILIYTLLALGLNIVVGFAGLLDLGYVAFFAIGGSTLGHARSVVSSPSRPLGLKMRISTSRANTTDSVHFGSTTLSETAAIMPISIPPMNAP